MFYGCDSATTSWPPGTSGTRFYIGQLGYLGSVTTGYFETSMADYATNNGGFVQGYWYLGSKPANSTYTDYSWGQHMANLAIQQATSNAYLKYGIGLIYGDVEVGSTGTWTGTVDENYETVKGFCAQLSAVGYTPGIYSAASQWNPTCGTNSAQTIAPSYGWTSEPQETSPPTKFDNASPFSDYTVNDLVMWQYESTQSADYDAYVD